MKQLLSFLNIEFLIKDDALKNWRMILFVSFLALLIISSGHLADRKIFKIAQLNNELKEMKSQFVEKPSLFNGIEKWSLGLQSRFAKKE